MEALHNLMKRAQTVLFFFFALDFYKKRCNNWENTALYLSYHPMTDETTLEPTEVLETVEELAAVEPVSTEEEVE